MLTKKEEAQIWDTMMARRRHHGPDPDDHPSIRRRMELEYVSTLIIIKWVVTKLAPSGGHEIQSSGKWHRTKAVFSHPMTAAAIIIATMTIYLSSRTFEKPTARQEYMRLVGRALIDAKPEIQTRMGSKSITITISGELLDGPAATLELGHHLSETGYRQLVQDLKGR